MELERACVEGVEEVVEAAAVACPSPGGCTRGQGGGGFGGLLWRSWHAGRLANLASHSLLLETALAGLLRGEE